MPFKSKAFILLYFYFGYFIKITIISDNAQTGLSAGQS